MFLLLQDKHEVNTPISLQECSSIDQKIPTGRHVNSVIHVVCYPHVDFDLLVSLLLIRLGLSFSCKFLLFISVDSRSRLFCFPRTFICLGWFDVMKALPPIKRSLKSTLLRQS
jgi:hypothetical protein